MVTFLKLNQENDSASIVVGDKMYVIIKHNDVGISVDYYKFAEEDLDQPFKSDQIWFDDLNSNDE